MPCCRQSGSNTAASALRGLLAGSLLLLCGCSLFHTDDVASGNNNPLPPLVAPRDSVQLDILFVDRPSEDPLLGDSLWRDVDQIAGLDFDVRQRLQAQGWKIGQASSHPPRALEELLAIASGQPEIIDPTRRLVGRRVALTTDHDFPIEVTELLPEFQIRMDDAEELKSYSNARCVLRTRIERQQDGWVRLHFLPEIHHGQNWLRPVATTFDWTRRRSQNIEPLYRHQFELTLNVGELALITGETTDDDASSTAGTAFFRSLDESGQLQRMVIIRVADMRRLTPVYTQ